MGISGILKEIGKGERIALSKLAVEHLERTRRPLRIAIDTAPWEFLAQSGRGGKNPALRTFFFRLLKLLALPIHPVFVYDGKNKPLTKRNRSVTRYGSNKFSEMTKKLIQELRVPIHTAPGEAEAECAFLQKQEIVDAVLSEDADAIMFGSTLTIRDFSSEGKRGNKTPTHVTVLRQADIKKSVNLDPAGMILVALLSGGDYNMDGIPGFGPALACEIAKAGFGEDLLKLVERNDYEGIQEWRERLQYELEANESGYFRTKHRTLKIPSTFPDRTILSYYTNPAISSSENLPRLKEKWDKTWNQEIDIISLREYVADAFDWRYKLGATRFIRSMGPVLLGVRLRRGTNDTSLGSADSIKERTHFDNGGIPELRVEMIPADIVGINLAEEEDNPEGLIEESETPGLHEDVPEAGEAICVSANPLKVRKPPAWDPYLPEKVWVPRTILKLGAPALVEEWLQGQQGPTKSATKDFAKSKKEAKMIDRGMKQGALDSFFPPSKGPRSNPVPKNPPRQPLQTRTELNTVRSPLARTKMQKIVPVCDKRKNTGATGSGSRLINISHGRISPNVQRRTGKSHSRPSTRGSYEEDTEEAAQMVSKLSSRQPAAQSPIHLKSAGTSFTESILISSSPLAPLTLSGGASMCDSNEDQQSSSSLPSKIKVMPIVTRRRDPKRRNILASPTAAKADEATVVNGPIGNFFKLVKPTQGVRSPEALDKSKSRQTQTPPLPLKMSTGLEIRLISAKLTILPRDSLPGTWTAVADDDEFSKSKRPRQRVSYVDLAGH